MTAFDTAPPTEIMQRPTTRNPRAAKKPDAARMYFPAVDGLRGLAILSVLLYHTSWFSNGLLGVDVFMVLSGFLITLLLFREADRSGRIAVGAFYRRRFKRLMPGLAITLIAALALAFAISGPSQARLIGTKAIASLLQVANWQQIADNDAYWAGFGEINPLAHMWSLSITEQFYLAWPLLFLLLYLICRRSAVAVTVLLFLILAGTATIAPLLYNGGNTDRLYLGTDIRTVDFVAGAAAAAVVFLMHRRAMRRRHADPAGKVVATLLGVLALAALIVISVLTSDYHEPWLYRGGIAAVAVITAILIATLSRPDGPLISLFSFGPLTEIGRISYTMYLLHLPVYWVLQEELPSIAPYALFIVGGGLTWLLSMFLHYAITERIRLRPWRALRATPVALATAALIVAGGVYLPVAVEQRLNPGGRPVLLLLGDSLSADFAEALVRDGRDQFAVVDGSIPGCGVMPSAAVRPRSGVVWPMGAECKIRERRWKEDLGFADYTAVVAHFGWDAADQFIDGRWITPCDPVYRTRYLASLTAAATFVASEVPGAPFLVMNERTGTEGAPDASVRCYNAILDTFIASGRARLLDFNALMCPAEAPCPEKDNAGMELFKDNVHFTDAGRAYIAPGLEASIAAALSAPTTPAPTKTPKRVS